MKFSEGALLEEIVLADGIVLRVEKGSMAQGCAREMVITMQPDPWVRVTWDEEGYPDEYFNMATLQRVRFAG